MLPSLIRKASCAAALSLVGLLAADASAADLLQKGSHLRIKFDKDVAEEIELNGEGVAFPGLVVVLINGDFMGIYIGVDHISVKGSAHHDTLRVDENVFIRGNLTVKTGAGDDAVYLSGFFGKNVKVSLGAGHDLLWEGSDPLLIVGSCTIKAGAGNDVIDIRQDIAILGKLSIDLGKGNPAFNTMVGLTEHEVEIGKTLSVRLSRQGAQDLVLEDVSAPKLVVRGGNGDNHVNLAPGNNVFGDISITKVETIDLP
jgi:hypothetical protein